MSAWERVASHPLQDWIVAAVVLCVYFLPSFVAWLLRHRRAGELFAINLLFGWAAFIVWPGCMAWAIYGPRRETPNERDCDPRRLHLNLRQEPHL